MENVTYSDELQHWGINGMKWGQRRYQNKDGSLTPAGRKRYSLGETIHNYKVKKKRQQALEKARQAKAAKAEHEKNAAEGKVALKDMTDDEIRKAIVRKQLENQYEALHPQKVSMGKEFAKKMMQEAIMPSMVTAGKKFLTDYMSKAIDNSLKVKVDPNSYEALKKSYDVLKIKKDIEDLKKPKEDSLADRAKEAEQKKKILEYEEALRKREEAESAREKKEKKAAEEIKAAEERKAEAQRQVDEYVRNLYTDTTYRKSGDDITDNKTATGKGSNTTRIGIEQIERAKTDGKVYGEGTSRSSIKEQMDGGKKWWDTSNVQDTVDFTANTVNKGQSFIAGLLEDKSR